MYNETIYSSIICSNVPGYVKLAARVVYSGIKENDTDFLNSEWCFVLKSLVQEYLDSYNRSIECKLHLTQIAGGHFD